MKTTKEKIAVMTAYENGEQIESRVFDEDLWVDALWVDAPNPAWNWGMIDYRVKKIEREYVDMGLPSGNLWGVKNENINDKSYFTYDEAVENFGDSLPTKDDFMELLKCCYHRWDENRLGIEFLSKNGNTLFFLARGYYFGSGVEDAGDDGNYWSSTPSGTDYAYSFNFTSNYATVTYDTSKYGQSVRLIKRK